MSEAIIIRNGGDVTLAAEVINQIKAIDAAKKAAAKAEADMKAAILAAMEENGVDKLTNDEAGLTINYFPPTETTVFDEKGFASEMPDLYLDYCTKPRKTRSYIKVSVKEKSDGAAE